MPQGTATHARVDTPPAPKRVRARVGATFVIDSTRAKLLIVGPRPVTYAVPVEDLRPDVVGPRSEARDHPAFGRVRDADLVVDGRRVERGLRFLEGGDLDAHVAVPWDAADGWYEEDEEVFVHPRDPHHRIDVRRSSRHVVVEVAGTKVAESRRPTLLFEAGLPVRTYLPPVDVDLGRLRESDTRTGCPYKGFARYHDVNVGGEWHEDLVWTYRTSFLDAVGVQGLLAFFDERVDVTVDGERQRRPRTPWSDATAKEAVERAAEQWR